MYDGAKFMKHQVLSKKSDSLDLSTSKDIISRSVNLWARVKGVSKCTRTFGHPVALLWLASLRIRQFTF